MSACAITSKHLAGLASQQDKRFESQVLEWPKAGSDLGEWVWELVLEGPGCPGQLCRAMRSEVWLRSISGISVERPVYMCLCIKSEWNAETGKTECPRQVSGEIDHVSVCQSLCFTKGALLSITSWTGAWLCRLICPGASDGETCDPGVAAAVWAQVLEEHTQTMCYTNWPSFSLVRDGNRESIQ